MPGERQSKLTHKAILEVRNMVAGLGLPESARILLAKMKVLPVFKGAESIPTAGPFIIIANPTKDNLSALYTAAACHQRTDVSSVVIGDSSEYMGLIEQHVLLIKDPPEKNVAHNAEIAVRATGVVQSDGGLITFPPRVGKEAFGRGIGIIAKRVSAETPVLFAVIDESNKKEPMVTFFPPEKMGDIIPNLLNFPDTPEGHDEIALLLQKQYADLKDAKP